jgi:hypothetical protein
MNTPLHLRIIKQAQARGSAATTARGAAKWLVQHRRPVTLFGHRGAVPAGHVAAYHTRLILRRGQPGTAVDVATTKRWKSATLTDPGLAAAAKKQGASANPRKRNLYTGAPRLSGGAFVPRWETINYKGSFKGWHGSELHCDYQSAVAVSPSGRTACLVQGGVLVRRIIAPAGLKWATNAQGAHLVRLTDGLDWHPSAEDLKARDLATRARAALAESFRRRRAGAPARRKAAADAKETARLDRIRSREIRTCRVTLEDSRKAGNCVEGSLRYAETRLKIPREDILNGSFLFSVSAGRLLDTNGDPGVQRAVNRAWLRETTVCI